MTIEGRAFNGNQITSIVIPANVSTIGELAFTVNPIISITILGDEYRFNDSWISIGFPKELKITSE